MNIVRRIVEFWLLGRAATMDNAFFSSLLTKLTTIVALVIGAVILGIILSAGIIALLYMFIISLGLQPVYAIIILSAITLIALIIVINALGTHINVIKKSSKKFLRHQSPVTQGISTVIESFMNGFLKK